MAASPLHGEHFDCVVIGAGMSGLAAGIRVAMGGKRVLLLERHSATGGLNSFYVHDKRRFDVGLHAMTNYVPEGVKGTPLVKIFRQLRLTRADFDLSPQQGSRILFKGQADLRFNNDFALLESEVEREFPQEIDGFRRLTALVKDGKHTSLDGQEVSARKVVAEYISDPLLTDMLFLPLSFYGSAKENDLDFSQFAILFTALFLEGFARPFDGVRTIIQALTRRYKDAGGERKMNLGVKRIIAEGSRAKRLVLDDGAEITAANIISSAGYAETLRLCSDQPADAGSDNLGKLSYVETITVLDTQPAETFGWQDTIVFFNTAQTFTYRSPQDLVDTTSGVICIPNNYRYPDARQLPEGWLRLTALANAQGWNNLSPEAYAAAKQDWYTRLLQSAGTCLPNFDLAALTRHTVATDMFTPKTITRYTGHIGGAIYGSPNKIKNGKTHLENLHLCGTDQGFLGITGALLSGISIANATNMHGS